MYWSYFYTIMMRWTLCKKVSSTFSMLVDLTHNKHIDDIFFLLIYTKTSLACLLCDRFCHCIVVLDKQRMTVIANLYITFSFPLFFSFTAGWTHQTGLSLSVLSLSSALNGQKALMWHDGCYCLQHVLISFNDLTVGDMQTTAADTKGEEETLFFILYIQHFSTRHIFLIILFII